jgi:hypothetical protein
MKSLLVALAFGVALPVSAVAQEAPPFLKAMEPQAAVNSAWQEWLAVFNPNGALDGKTKELIGLAGSCASSLRILRLRPHLGRQARRSDGRADQGGHRRFGAGAKNEH